MENPGFPGWNFFCAPWIKNLIKIINENLNFNAGEWAIIDAFTHAVNKKV